MSLVSMFKGAGAGGSGYGPTAEWVTAGLDLHGKTRRLTGCASGLGLATMRVLSFAARTRDRDGAHEGQAEAARVATAADGTALACDLAEPDSVRARIADVRALRCPLDAISCNAGCDGAARVTPKHKSTGFGSASRGRRMR